MSKSVGEQRPGVLHKFSRRELLRGALVIGGVSTVGLLAGCKPPGSGGSASAGSGSASG